VVGAPAAAARGSKRRFDRQRRSCLLLAAQCLRLALCLDWRRRTRSAASPLDDALELEGGPREEEEADEEDEFVAEQLHAHWDLLNFVVHAGALVRWFGRHRWHAHGTGPAYVHTLPRPLTQAGGPSDARCVRYEKAPVPLQHAPRGEGATRARTSHLLYLSMAKYSSTGKPFSLSSRPSKTFATCAPNLHARSASARLPQSAHGRAAART
jgi:hypothetical protein